MCSLVKRTLRHIHTHKCVFTVDYLLSVSRVTSGELWQRQAPTKLGFKGKGIRKVRGHLEGPEATLHDLAKNRS